MSTRNSPQIGKHERHNSQRSCGREPAMWSFASCWVMLMLEIRMIQLVESSYSFAEANWYPKFVVARSFIVSYDWIFSEYFREILTSLNEAL